MTEAPLGHPHGDLFRCEAEDPVAVAECHELLAHLEQIVQGLDDEGRQFCDQIKKGKPLKETAAQLGISYQTAWRHEHKLLEELKTRLEDHTD